MGSAVVVQWEDGRQWTHETVVNTGDHNHHNCVYIIQLTTNGRRITCNRQHIKPTLVTAETYLQYQTTKQSNTWTDPLEDILKCISNNPMVYANMYTTNNNIHNSQYHQQTKNTQQGRGEGNRKAAKLSITITDKKLNTPENNGIVQQNSEVVKTRYGQRVKKPDRLSYT